MTYNQSAPLPILVVDDDNALLRTVADILEMHGYAPQTAATGGSGLAVAATMKPAVALVDLRLPDMNGLELAARLHSLSDTTQVVVLTGNATLESAVAAMRESSIDYLVKPVNIEHLLKAVGVAGERWQRLTAEAALRATNARFRRIVNSDMLGICFWNETGLITEANSAFLDMLGYSQADVLAEKVHWLDISPPEFEGQNVVIQTQLGERGVCEQVERELIRKDRSRVPVMLGSALLEDREGQGVSYVLDISKRRYAERILQERVRQQAAVATLGERAFRSHDPDEIFAHAVAVVADTLGVPLVGLLELIPNQQSLAVRANIGWSADTATLIPADQTTLAGRAIFAGQPVAMTDIGSLGNNEVRRALNVVSGVAVPIAGAYRPFGALAAFTTQRREFTQDDIHFLQAVVHIIGNTVEREQRENGFRQTQRLEAVGRLAGGVAHDFNNLLTAITGYSQLLLDEMPAGAPMREDIGEIFLAAQRATTLTKQLLAFSRQQVLQPRIIDLNTVVSDIQNMLRRLIGEHIELVTELTQKLGCVKADPGQIEQMLVNLVVNARDALPDGGRILIETGNVDLDGAYATEYLSVAPGAYVMLAVTDNGIGMDRETRLQIFEPFFTTKGVDKGTGLGLATVYGIVKQSGGGLWVYSEPGHGTSFKIYFPRRNEDATVMPPEAREPAELRGTETVLFAEDDEIVRRFGVKVLRDAGYTVLVANDGDEALKISAEYEGTIDLIATDVVMPNLSGHELATRIAAMRSSTAVLYLSGYTDSSLLRQGVLEGAAVFVQKPFTAHVLLAKVRAALTAGVN